MPRGEGGTHATHGVGKTHVRTGRSPPTRTPRRWPALGGPRRRRARRRGAALLSVVGARAVRVAARRRGSGVRAGARPCRARSRLAARARGGDGGRGLRLRDHPGDGHRRGSRDPALAGGDPAGGALVLNPARRPATAAVAGGPLVPRRGGGAVAPWPFARPPQTRAAA